MNTLCKILGDISGLFAAIMISLVLVSITGCGGSEDYISEEERLIQFCEAQGLDAQLLQVYNVDTGESYLDVQCVKPEIEVKYCKLGGEC